MRFMFKTDYEDDIRLFPHSGYVVSYGVLLALLLIAPFVLSSYIVSQLVFVCIYATVGVGLMILTGFTGQASLGHAAFLAIGAYTTAYLQQFGVPFLVYFLAAGLSRDTGLPSNWIVLTRMPSLPWVTLSQRARISSTMKAKEIVAITR